MKLKFKGVQLFLKLFLHLCVHLLCLIAFALCLRCVVLRRHVSHPNIAMVIGIAERITEGQPSLLLVSELCKSGSLASIIYNPTHPLAGSVGVFCFFAFCFLFGFSFLSLIFVVRSFLLSLLLSASLTFDVKKRIALEIALGMNFLHDQHVLHLDLKQENVLVS